MRAIVQDTYGRRRGRPRLQEIDRPQVGDDDVLIRVQRGRRPHRRLALMTGLPYLMRVVGFGLRAPKARVRGMDVAGTVEAVGKNVTGFRAGDEVFGTCNGSFAEYASARGHARAQAGEPHLRAGGRRSHLRLRRPPGAPRRRQASSRASRS